MGHGEIVLTALGGLDEDLYGLHAQDWDSVAACQEH